MAVPAAGGGQRLHLAPLRTQRPEQRQIDVYRAVVVNEDAEPLPLTQQEAGIAQQKTGLSRAEKARDQIDRDHPQLKRTTRWAKR